MRVFDGMEDTSSRAGSLPLVGGVLALDFCNTSSGRGTPGHKEHLRSADDVIAWARHAAILDAANAERLRRRCDADRDLARALLDRALEVRDAIHGLHAALALGRAAAQADLDAIARTHAACLAKGRLVAQDDRFGWSWDVETAPEEAILGPIVASAMTVVALADRGRLKRCDGHQCGWLFLDTSKSNNRRWCEMEVCGNRAKQKRRRDPSPTGG